MIKGSVERVRAEMEREGIDAIVAFQPLNMQYLVGYQPPALILKVVGAYSATVCRDPDLAPALIVGEFDEMWARSFSGLSDVRRLQLWVEIEDLDRLEAGDTKIRAKKEQFDWDQVFQLLSDVLGERRLLSAKIACEFNALPDYFRSRLLSEFPNVEFVDSHGILDRAMAIKTPAEIGALRTSVQLSEIGLRAALLDNDPRGKTGSQLRNLYDAGVRAAVADDPELSGFQECRAFISVGGVIGPNVSRDGTVVKDGDIIWIDCGVTVDGYQADIGRTIAVGQVPDIARRIGAALEAGGAAGFEAIGLGAAMSSVFEATQAAVRSNGLPTYTRGHVGHAIGVGGGEHTPFLSPTEREVFAPDMVFAFERPFYVRGLGGFQYEDNLLSTQTGIERLTELPTGMLEV